MRNKQDDGMMGFPSDWQPSEEIAQEPAEVSPQDIFETTALAEEMDTADIVLPKPKKAGRPTKESKQKTEDGESLLKKMVAEYEEGASDIEICQTLKLPYKEFDKKVRNDSMFRTLVEYGRLAAKAWWYKKGREGTLKKGSLDYAFWAFNMKNRYGWAEKSDILTDDKPVNQRSTDELMAQLALFKPKLRQHFADHNIEMDEEQAA